MSNTIKAVKIDKNKINWNRIATSASNAKNKQFINSDSILTEEWGDNEGKVSLQKRDDGTYIITQDEIAMEYTNEETAETKWIYTSMPKKRMKTTAHQVT